MSFNLCQTCLQEKGVDCSQSDFGEGATVPQALVAKVLNLERGLARIFSIVGGAKA